jgi:excisionase family DNA binding protein
MAEQNYSEPRAWTDEQLLFTAEEAARALHVGRTTLFALIKNGELHAVHIGRSCRLTRAELLRYVTRLDRTTSPSRPNRSPRRDGRTSVNQGGLFDLDPTPPDAA